MLRNIFSRLYSQLTIVGDNSVWAIDEEARVLEETAKKLGIKASRAKRTPFNFNRLVHYCSQFSLLNEKIYKSRHKISLDYFHGKPEQGENFRKCFEALEKRKQHIGKVRVSTKEMEGLIGQIVGTEKVMRIPIGVDLNLFKKINDKSKARSALRIPNDALVIGSFQKDGSGWGEGNEPKIIKGPDIFIKVLQELKKEFPSVYVLLSGPSRGFVKNGLDKSEIPYKHFFPKDYKEIAKLYEALDLYIVTSREEGGPKAILESMAMEVPLITTRVGQATDLVKHGQNAMMAEIDDVHSLVTFASQILKDQELRNTLIKGGLETAEKNSLEKQIPLWKEYFKGLIK